MKMKILFSILVLLVYLLLPSHFVIAHGGCLKTADELFVQLSASPISQLEGEEVSHLFSFGDKNGLISGNISGKIRIMENGQKVHERNFETNDGIFDFKYKYDEPGIYEIFVEFKYNNKIHSPEDFMLEVREKGEQAKKSNYTFAYLAVGLIFGYVGAIIIKRRK